MPDLPDLTWGNKDQPGVTMAQKNRASITTGTVLN